MNYFRASGYTITIPRFSSTHLASPASLTPGLSGPRAVPGDEHRATLWELPKLRGPNIDAK